MKTIKKKSDFINELASTLPEKRIKKAYKEANREKERAYHKAYRETNSEKVKAAIKAYKKANPEKIKAASKAYYETNRERLKAVKKVYYGANSERLKTYHKAWCTNPLNAAQRRIYALTGLKKAEIPTELLEAQALIISINREIKNQA